MRQKTARHQLILSLITETKIHTQQELLEALAKNGVKTTQATLSRDMRELNLVKVAGDTSYYEVHSVAKTRWEDRLRFYMEDALVMMRPVQHQVVLKTSPGLAASFGSMIDAMQLPDVVATICGDDTCLVICETNAAAQACFDSLSSYAPSVFYSEK